MMHDCVTLLFTSYVGRGIWVITLMIPHLAPIRLHDASLPMHPNISQASKFPVAFALPLSLGNPNPLGAIHIVNDILGHPNGPVPSIVSPPYGMSHHLAFLLLLKNVMVALLLVLVGGLGVD